MRTTIISGAWQKIIMINYAVDPGLLMDLVPPGTKVSLYDGKCLLTLAGFLFCDIKAFGVPIPFHKCVPGVNLRFYVESSTGREQKKGVVFVRELASRRLLAAMTSLFYKQKHDIKSIHYGYKEDRTTASIKYSWGFLRRNQIMVKFARVPGLKVKEGSEEDYIFHNFFGFANRPYRSTFQYQFTHPEWTSWRVLDWKVKVNFEKSFGERFAFLSRQKPHSILATEGSPIAIHRPSRLPFTRIEAAA